MYALAESAPDRPRTWSWSTLCCGCWSIWPRAASRAGVSEVARELGISKARAHRHLRALVQRGYARQDARTDGYEIGVKVLALGEAVRDRFDAAAAMRPADGRRCARRPALPSPPRC